MFRPPTRRSTDSVTSETVSTCGRLTRTRRTPSSRTLQSTWLLEGPAYKINTANPLNSSPLWRFVNIRGGYYLYTANPAEKASIIAKLASTWRYEGPAYNVSTNTSGSPVWRFRNKQNGTYLYSADLNEKNNIVAKLSATWQLEGPAYYLAP